MPLPFGGKFRQVMVDLNPEALYAKQLSPADVSNALGQQSLILPAGDVKIGDMDYQVKLNNSPVILDQLNDLPIKVVNGATVYLKDVAQVRDGYAVQTSIVRTNGTRGALLTVSAERQSLHAGHRGEGEGGAAQDPGRAAAGAGSAAVVRSVAVRARGHRRRGARSGDRRVPHRPDDPDVPGKLAQHHHRLHLHSALDSDFAGRFSV